MSDQTRKMFVIDPKVKAGIVLTDVIYSLLGGKKYRDGSIDWPLYFKAGLWMMEIVNGCPSLKPISYHLEYESQ